MARRPRRNRSSFLDDLFAFLQLAPWWVGPVLAGLVFGGLYWGVPWLLSAPDPDDLMNRTIHQVFGGAAPTLAPFVGGLVVVLWAFAELRKWTDRARLNVQTGAESIRQLDWQSFERLLGEAFRREGYAVEIRGGAGPDGGVDLRLQRGGGTHLVQCKHWKSAKVGVTVVRELLGVVTHARATGGVVVTSGRFTEEAERFAESSGMRLIDGPALVEMIRAVQTKPSMQAGDAHVPVRQDSAGSREPACPRCGASMKLRTARQGAHAGAQFWGCSTYPQCRGTLKCDALCPEGESRGA